MLLKYSLLFSVPIVFLLLSLSFGGTSKPVSQQLKPAVYERGSTVMVQTIVVGPRGGTIKVDSPSSPIDGASISIPPGTFEKESNVSLGYNEGKLSPVSGRWSGVVLVLEVDKAVRFDKPITISVRFDPAIRPRVITGFEIDELSRLHTVDFAGMDKTLGTVSFYTFKPLMLTWIYVM